jgi:hypothetical protein
MKYFIEDIRESGRALKTAGGARRRMEGDRAAIENGSGE